MNKFIVFLIMLISFSCQTKHVENIDFDKMSETPIFNQVTQSKLDVINYSIEKQLIDISNRLDYEKLSKEEKELIQFVDSLSLELDTMKIEIIYHSGGYKEKSGGVMFPFNTSGVKNYFYSENKFDSFAYKNFDNIIKTIKIKYSNYLNCETESIFNFQDINFYKNQEPNLNKPNEILIQNKCSIEVLHVIQILKFQLEVIKMKIKLKFIC